MMPHGKNKFDNYTSKITATSPNGGNKLMKS